MRSSVGQAERFSDDFIAPVTALAKSATQRTSGRSGRRRKHGASTDAAFSVAMFEKGNVRDGFVITLKLRHTAPNNSPEIDFLCAFFG
ncbi:MAG: hypothetical protein H0X66_14380 [Verrucomicrobia bacterium]|nr:hypothetical protein [Verrucomicrobiota bacterium]